MIKSFQRTSSVMRFMDEAHGKSWTFFSVRIYLKITIGNTKIFFGPVLATSWERLSSLIQSGDLQVQSFLLFRIFLDFMFLSKLKFVAELILDREKIIFSHHQGFLLEAPQ